MYSMTMQSFGGLVQAAMNSTTLGCRNVLMIATSWTTNEYFSINN
jgi:hypothetical protein